MIDREDFFDDPVKNSKITYQNIRKIAIGQRYDYTTACFIDHAYFSDNYKTIAKYLSKPISIRFWS